ncbi:hypothetical protein MS2017_0479 [Bathymodiolus thermophilus thioautotrophic gill symbiont]|uniref:Uncharacterized protein n=1 Tax=Bathymodiolus thermophilus thioautotrophic gill symbiont TaxID=2360 RepID=A0A3G3IKE9_9GAMM|nr:hypothetical protein MS2017_0479 [Bathymodiolus thermophilus thioautotrophic gill symbiont]
MPTISRELSRNTGKRGYRHKQACERHKEKDKTIKLTVAARNHLAFALQGKAVGGAFYKYLRHQYKRMQRI